MVQKWVYCIALQSNDDIDDGDDKGINMRFEEDLYDEWDEDADDEYEKGEGEDENKNVDEKDNDKYEKGE